MAKTLMLGKIEGRRSRREDEVVAWLHQPSGNEFEQTLGEEMEAGLAEVHGVAKSKTQLRD